MLGTHDLPLFVISGLLLNITPGADSLYIASRATSQGLKAGVVAAFGIVTGCCVHVAAAALGLSAVLATSATAFTIVKLIGAAYLVWIGLTMIRPRTGEAAAPAGAGGSAAPLRTVFAQGFLTNVLNPKVALFFLAFVPQFIAPEAPHKPLAFLFLGGLFNANSLLVCLGLAWASARIGARIAVSGVPGRAASALRHGIGAFFVLLGVRLALSGRE